MSLTQYQTQVIKVCLPLLICAFGFYEQITAQSSKMISMDEAVYNAIENNPLAKNAVLKTESIQLNESHSILNDPMQITYAAGQTAGNQGCQFFQFTQPLGSVFTEMPMHKFNQQKVNEAVAEQKLLISRLKAKTKTAYTCWLCDFVKLRLIQKTIDLLSLFGDSTGLPAGAYDTVYMDRMEIQTTFAGIQNMHFQAEEDLQISARLLNQLMYSNGNYNPSDTSLELYAIEPARSGEDKFYPTHSMEFFNASVLIQKENIVLEKSRFLPEFSLGYFNWKLTEINHFQGFQIGMTLPIWYFPQKNKVSQAHIMAEIAQNVADEQESTLKLTIENLRTQLDKLFVDISYYRENELILAGLQDDMAVKGMSENKQGFNKYLHQFEQSLQSKLAYLEKVKTYNLNAIELEYYIN